MEGGGLGGYQYPVPNRTVLGDELTMMKTKSETKLIASILIQSCCLFSKCRRGSVRMCVVVLPLLWMTCWHVVSVPH